MGLAPHGSRSSRNRNLREYNRVMPTCSPPIRVLFLCTHNSARSILSEALLNHLGGDRFRAYSAGSSPRPNQSPNPLALETLREAGISVDGLRSKNWDEFGAADAPSMDLVITVCDNAAAEVCPVWPGHPATAHWSYADPSAIVGNQEDKRAAFRNTLALIRQRLDRLVNLSDEALSPEHIQRSARALAEE